MDPGAALVLIAVGIGTTVGFAVGVISSLLRTRPFYVGAVVVAAGLIDAFVRRDPTMVAVMLLASPGWPLGSWLQRTLAAGCRRLRQGRGVRPRAVE